MSTRKDIQTDCGMLGLWDAESFNHLVDYESWDRELGEDEDIRRNIREGKLVPLDMKTDGLFAVDVRFGPTNSMTEREREFIRKQSQPYFLKTAGRVMAAGLEEIGPSPRDFVLLDIPAGEYGVRAQVLDWSRDPNSIDENGNPHADSLPDMLVFIYPASEESEPFRQEVETFRSEDFVAGAR